MKKLVLATGIFPPDIGGPAFYTRELAKEFSRRGIRVSAVTYGKKNSGSLEFQLFNVSRKWPIGFRQFIYFLKVLILAKDSDAILAFDSLGAGLPAALAGKILKKKVLIRLGGDFLWEKFVESGHGEITITEFYRRGLHHTFIFLRPLIIFTLRNSRVVFTTEFQKNLFVVNYNLDARRVSVADNIFEKKKGEIMAYQDNPKVILWTGRFIKLKNLVFLIRVFNRLIKQNNNLVLELIGNGPEESRIANFIQESGLSEKVKILNNLDEEFLFNRIKSSYFCILPSLSEISPNFALRCLDFNKPIILTQENGIKGQFPGLMYADPKNEDSFFSASLRLFDKNSYHNYQKFISDIQYRKTWQNLAEEYLKLLNHK